ncbi:DNA-binding protein [Lacisediminihabitans changchengi]|uniref:DNA-binding protein n=1 Tax=Lacisediminihabitans changchengi TaxID=2787634 RepID=A0A934VY52_9MICO|nr:DNA-binding protein [Lacisediminihabitans changchengi]MBK4347642.1 DNA-binding protein [Lacisediminihabitans changchengi]
MFVITADQVDSRHRDDIAAATVSEVNDRWGSRLVLSVDRTAGDEIQLMPVDGSTMLEIALHLTRDGAWSVGCAIGDVVFPLPHNTREATGQAFVDARDAVEAAKKRDTRFALRGPGTDLEPLIDLVLLLRARRSAEGWELYDRLVGGMTQSEAATALGITPQAASKRARAASIRPELAATTALAALLDAVESTTLADDTTEVAE